MERCINQTLFGRDFPSSLLTAMPQLTKKHALVIQTHVQKLLTQNLVQMKIFIIIV